MVCQAQNEPSSFHLGLLNSWSPRWEDPSSCGREMERALDCMEWERDLVLNKAFWDCMEWARDLALSKASCWQGTKYVSEAVTDSGAHSCHGTGELPSQDLCELLIHKIVRSKSKWWLFEATKLKGGRLWSSWNRRYEHVTHVLPKII